MMHPEQDWRAHLQQTAGLHLQFIQQQVYLGNVTDTTDLARFFYGLPEVMHSRRALLSPSSASPLRVLNLIRALTSSGYANLGSNLSLRGCRLVLIFPPHAEHGRSESHRSRRPKQSRRCW